MFTGHVGDAERYRQPELQTTYADLDKRMRTWRHRLVFGAIRGRLAPQVGRVFSRGSSEPRKTILACRCGLTVELSCGPTTLTVYVLGKASVARRVARLLQRLVRPRPTPRRTLDNSRPSRREGRSHNASRRCAEARGSPVSVPKQTEPRQRAVRVWGRSPRPRVEEADHRAKKQKGRALGVTLVVQSAQLPLSNMPTPELRIRAHAWLHFLEAA